MRDCDYRRFPAIVLAVAAALLVACGGAVDFKTDVGANSNTLIAAGDIALCGDGGSEETARLLDELDGTIAALGDNAYEDGRIEEFEECYEPTWGRHLSRTRPAPGNHEYHLEQASGYFEYFGSSAGPEGRGFYSYDLGSWHIVALNSECAEECASEQADWLEADLAGHDGACTLAYWHRPIASAGPHDDIDGRMLIYWQMLYDHGTDVLLAGHDHTYQQFERLNRDADGTSDDGIRQFIVGTGGRSLTDIDPDRAANTPGLAFWADTDHDDDGHNGSLGVLKLSLHEAGYEWEFIPVAGGAFTDSGHDTCS